MHYIRTYGFLLLHFFSVGRLLAQSKVQVVTKTVEQSFPYKAGEIIFIQGEKASIQVMGWTSQEVKVVLRLVAKAPTTEVAREALEYQRYILEKKRDAVQVKNYFAVPGGKFPIKALLLAEYEIWVPRESSLKIKNQYGNTTISNKNGETEVDTRYGNITLDQVKGNNIFKNYFGDFTAKNLGGQIRAQFNHTKTSIQGLSGKAEFNTTLGDMSLGDLTGIQSLKIDASKSDISLAATNAQANQYYFTTEFGNITVPESFRTPIKRKPNESATWQYGAAHLPAIHVKTTFGKITLETE
ncbi:hypothetical protein AHMF7605_07785 [Adhaeribacter arboris]|uniref:DUF4097 domain-containing protein n=1 Tax=Adhaeribacter arboris TaxID=2072846 RepID=A0A2T2YD61_9BACT|nr:DUF4097 family beta strand repeat-containing protein [Adhaeribacter arboris]PSR53433.1 hypothetical protein AHMF7605_07785 [Adhaeribacter arboris]